MLHSCFRGKGEISLRGVVQFPKHRSLRIGRTSEWHCKSERANKGSTECSGSGRHLDKFLGALKTLQTE